MSAGKGTRLLPLTKVVSKEMLPVYDRPMIYYPIQTLASGGIEDILLIFAPEHVDRYRELLGDGSEFGVQFTYTVQEERRGTADSLLIGADFVGKDDVTVIYGDNIFEHDFSAQIKSFTGGAMLYVKEVDDPRRFGVVELDTEGKVVSVEEKPAQPKSHFAQVGLFTYDCRAVEYAREVVKSPRGELEITDVNKRYLRDGELKALVIEGVWEDAGTFDSLLRINNFVAEKRKGQK